MKKIAVLGGSKGGIKAALRRYEGGMKAEGLFRGFAPGPGVVLDFIY
jgi:hypothetical protein